MLVFTLTLSGCDRETIMPNVDDTRYYTQEEVDILLQDFCWDIFGIDDNCIDAHKDVQAIFEEYDTEFYTINERVRKLNERVMELESELRDFERFEYEDLIEFMEFFENDFEEALKDFLLTEYGLGKELTSDDVIDQIDRDIVITTIAQIDLVLYGLENAQYELTEDEQFVYDLYSGLREMLYNNLGDE
jgi:hypothetical protein